MKKFFIFLVVTALTLGVVTSARAGQIFPDVKSGHWAEKDIAKMKAKGIVAGFSDGYHPGEPVTREQAIVMIVKAMGKEQEAKGKTLPATFKNADKVSSWAKEPLALAVQEGIVSGGDLLDFRPKEAAKRYEMAVFIGRALGFTAADIGTKKPGFKDASQIPGWAQGYVAAVVEEGVMSGLNDGTFRPNDSLNRAQMASLLASLDKKLDRLSNSTLRGEVFSVSSTSNSLLVKNSSGLIQTVQLAKDAYIYKNKSISLSGLAKGDQVLAVLNGQNEALFVEVVEGGLPAATEQIISGTIKTVQQGSPAAVTIKHSAGESTFTVDASAQLFIDNEGISPSGLAAGQEVTVVVKNGKIEKLTGRTLEREITGEIKLITRGSTVTLKIKEDSGSENNYTLGDAAEVYLDYKEAGAADLFVGQKVIMKVKGLDINKIYASSVKWEAAGKLVSVAFAPEETITIEDEDGKKETYKLAKDARVRRNSNTVSLRDLVPGDKVELELENNKVNYVYAEKVESEAAGRVKAITIASSSSITITTSDNNEETYKISAQAEIRKDRKRIDLTQIKVGDYVELELEGELVTKMDVEARFVQTYYVGKIENINAKSKVLVLKTDEENDEYKQVFISSGTYIIKFDDDISFSDLEEEDEVIAVGEYEAGVFNASSIIVIGSRE
ncbi:S-layer homology domain-containing protein [Zhaonella formicivorans]|uniref:S-layer homology domain-containing protein n=1 Tax=Zhaonella formicivorans TaxID=2528593 RepID=UPI001D112EFE|nr:S-layer homology domain-containing protein [Zhaonella formicivorans]